MTMLTRACTAALAVLLCAGSRTAFAQDAFGSLSSAHFDVKYQRGVPQEDARRVMDFCQSEYRSLAGDLGLEPKSRIEVQVYESDIVRVDHYELDMHNIFVQHGGTSWDGTVAPSNQQEHFRRLRSRCRPLLPVGYRCTQIQLPADRFGRLTAAQKSSRSRQP